ncbi:MAG: hypothetical protein V4514_17340 [Pseudomonadota bacterium]|uniref:hypothetical protein n=1 Tax=Phenylobacterium sp. TaxID=1871053 RepID=UPI0026012A4F|nr:hypothetical protein [Phenylobacterium sp.]MBT9472924.1 hypothetical protein [Phenylobacterium sp.]
METRDPDIVALADPHNVEFWRAHPDVEKVEQLHLDTEADGPSVELSIWLRPGAADEPFEVPVMGEEPPEREPDLFLGGDGFCTASWFWDRVQSLEFADYMEDLDPTWWGVKLWLKQPELIALLSTDA